MTPSVCELRQARAKRRTDGQEKSRCWEAIGHLAVDNRQPPWDKNLPLNASQQLFVFFDHREQLLDEHALGTHPRLHSSIPQAVESVRVRRKRLETSVRIAVEPRT
jgi:hypothetical protein